MTELIYIMVIGDELVALFAISLKAREPEGSSIVTSDASYSGVEFNEKLNFLIFHRFVI